MIVDSFQSSRLEFASLDPDRLSVRYVDWLNDPEVNQYLESRFSRHTAESVRRYVADDNASSVSLLLGIHERATGLHVGNIRISCISRQHRTADLGLMIGEKDRWGRGYARESIAAVTGFAFGTLKLRKLSAGCYASNMASARAFVVAGYTQIARLREHWVENDGYVDDILLERLADEVAPVRDPAAGP